MAHELPSGDDGSEDLSLEIVEALEACGLGRDQYRLHDYLDVEALERLVTNSDGVSVHVTVEGARLVISSCGVRVIGVR